MQQWTYADRSISGLIMGAESLSPTVLGFQRRLGMYTLNATFGEACALIQGFDAALHAALLVGFRPWLRERTNERPELAWPALAIAYAFPDEPIDLRTITGERDRGATDVLFALLSEFLALGEIDDRATAALTATRGDESDARD